MKRRSIVACTALLCIVCVGMAFGGDKAKLSGMITGRTGDNLTVRTKDAASVIVVLSDDTKVEQPKGLLKIRKEDMGFTALMPGLKISVEGTGDPQTKVEAKTIRFSKDDLQLAETIQAGLTPTAQQASTNKGDIATNKEDIAANKVQTAANRESITESQQNIATNQQDIAANQQDIQATTKRFNELSEYDTKGDLTVYFSTGSATIAAKDQAALTQLAQSAVALTGYIIQVKGFADTTGQAAMNQKLSMERAQAVVAYLLQNCNVPQRHIVAPGAMGVADPAAPNETSQGRQENRRVEVKVLVNRGVAGGL